MKLETFLITLLFPQYGIPKNSLHGIEQKHNIILLTVQKLPTSRIKFDTTNNFKTYFKWWLSPRITLHTVNHSILRLMHTASQVKVFLVTANPFPLPSASLASVIAGCIIIPLDLYVIFVSNGSLSFPPCHYTAYKCLFPSEGALPLPLWVLPRNTTLILPATCNLPPVCGI